MHESTQTKDKKFVDFEGQKVVGANTNNDRQIDVRSLSIASDVQSKILSSTMSYLLVKERPTSNTFLLDLVRNDIYFGVDEAINITKSDDILCEKYEVQPRNDLCDKKGRIQMSQIKEEDADSETEPMKMFSSSNCDETYCNEFLEIVEIAKLLISNVTLEAIHSLNKMLHINYEPRISLPHQLTSTGWISIKDFTILEGLNLIQDYIQKCGYFHNDWKYTIEYKGYKEDSTAVIFIYEAVFSLPCRLYPIPQVTASLYFNIEVSNVIPNYCPIKVYFLIEGSRQKMNPEKFILQDNMFLRILEIKLKHFQTFTF